MPLKRALYDLAVATKKQKQKERRTRKRGPSAKKLAEKATREFSRDVKNVVKLAADVTKVIPIIPPPVKVPLALGLDLGAETIGDFTADVVSPILETSAERLLGRQVTEPIPTFRFDTPSPTPTPTPPLPFSEYPQFRSTPQPEMRPMTPIEILEAVINEPTIQLTEDMLAAINDPGVMMRNGQMLGQFTRANLLRTKKKRKVSKYQKEFGKQLKMLKKKHPRTPVTRLMKRAHAATRKALKR